MQIHPGNTGAHNGLGFIFLRQREVGKAVVQFQQTLAVQPGNVEAQNNLAWVWATCPNSAWRNGAKALELAQRANQLSGGRDPAILGTLAAAYAETGHFPEAVASAQAAMQLSGSQTNAYSLVNELQMQIRFYRAGIPFRDGNLTDIQVPNQ